ncbi:Pet127-domain-containing protein [Cucurbitaria berberidis CBS 394.84]|uniref:Pet127-domain-containing protein n=1 Tax=Cucurbitaria berberidis CBS 394.84 TaxID=1168544 RepID=A0A9P4LDG8_9PLEO|nr:Pet127-domain-containing protein [Cucurbitaria berberidis CBS 394.84]KAF1850823.1 Pet127-domain-containing protein [Cucurbitaria berberidis CBS 394.84]
MLGGKKPRKETSLGGKKPVKEALLGDKKTERKRKAAKPREQLPISILYPENLQFEPVDVEKPPVPMLSYGLDRVLFNPGVYRLQDPRSRLYNFDPYLEKIMPVNEFDFDALSEYKTSSKDEELLAMTKRLGSKFTGSTSSMSGILQHFHFILSNFRQLNHEMLSREFPDPSPRFSKLTYGPSAIFLRYKDGVYAIDADKTYDRPNIMSWLGHSLEKLLTTERTEFERYRRSSPEKAPVEDNASRCYHYSKQGNLLMRSQLDAYDPRLPGSGIFDLKTRAVISIRMNHKEYEEGAGYQLRKERGQWESFEREFYDMTRATLLKYSLQVRMGRMDGIFIAFHNIERIFGFQYLSLPDMDAVLHGQHDTCLGNQEFKLSVGLVDELLTRATTQFPNTSLRLHFDSREGKTSFMYVFAEPVTEELADQIQGAGNVAQNDFARTVVGVGRDDPDVQAAWQTIQDEVDEQVDEDKNTAATMEAQGADVASQQEEVTNRNEDDIEANAQDTVTTAKKSSTVNNDSDGPLMGWTLTVRSKVNGEYVERPEQLAIIDDWRIEYHIKDIPQETRWKLYNAVKERRRKLIGQDEEEIDVGLKHYRDKIQRYSDSGRKWRKKQDKLDEAQGVHVYRPLGPGSDVTQEEALPTAP